MDEIEKTIEQMADAADSVDLPDPPDGALKMHPRQHRKLVAEVRPNINDPEDVEYCDNCWHVVDGDACPECGSSERYDFA